MPRLSVNASTTSDFASFATFVFNPSAMLSPSSTAPSLKHPSTLPFLVALTVASLPLVGCSPKEKPQPATTPAQAIQQAETLRVETTVLLDIDNSYKIVLTIDGWHDYRPGDIISAQGGGGEGTWEIVHGYFVVKPSPRRPSQWEPAHTKFYYVRAPQSTSAAAAPR